MSKHLFSFGNTPTVREKSFLLLTNFKNSQKADFFRMKKKECSCLNFRIHAEKGKFSVQLSSKKLIVGMRE
jgi:hypothetical protein